MEELPQIYLVRHGQTQWSLTGQHTGRTDIPLTAEGEQQAKLVGRRLSGQRFSQVFTSPSLRARRTAELAGFGATAQVDPDLPEWDYGDFEGLRSTEIHARQPDWNIYRDGAPHGESVSDMVARADRVVQRLRACKDRTLVFSSGHFLRVLAARWLGLEITEARIFFLSTGSLSILGYEHTLQSPIVLLWNEQPAG